MTSPTTTVDQLTRAYEAEQRSAAPARTRDDLPVSYEAVTGEWLTSVLCADHPGAEVTAYRLGPPDDGNSNRRRIFLQYNTAGDAAGLPETVFCKATHNLANRVTVGLTGGMAAEMNFYNRVRPLLDGVETPVALFARADPHTLNSILVMHDLTDEATFCTHTTQITRELAEMQLALLAKVHGRFLESPELDGPLSVFASWPEWFGRLATLRLEESCDTAGQLTGPLVPGRRLHPVHLPDRRGPPPLGARAAAPLHRPSQLGRRSPDPVRGRVRRVPTPADVRPRLLDRHRQPVAGHARHAAPRCEPRVRAPDQHRHRRPRHPGEPRLRAHETQAGLSRVRRASGPSAPCGPRPGRRDAVPPTAATGSPARSLSRSGSCAPACSA